MNPRHETTASLILQSGNPKILESPEKVHSTKNWPDVLRTRLVDLAGLQPRPLSLRRQDLAREAWPREGTKERFSGGPAYPGIGCFCEGQR